SRLEGRNCSGYAAVTWRDRLAAAECVGESDAVGLTFWRRSPDPGPWMLLGTWRARTIITGVAYVVAGEIALLWALPPDHAATIWPAAGIALVAVSRWGASAALGVIGGSFAVNAI